MEITFYRTLSICVCLILAAASGYASDSTARIELRCKIVPISAAQEQEPQSWIVELKETGGAIVRVAKALDQQTVHFKNLDPGIYRACVVGSFDRIRCKSVDVNPPADRKSFLVRIELEAPVSLLNEDDLHKISAAQLAVPQMALDEMEMAQLAQFHGQDREAINHLRAALDIDPDYSDALNNLGIYYHRDGENEKAIECFAKVTQLKPDFYGGWVNLSGSLMSVSEFEKALYASVRAYQIRPQDPTVLVIYGKSLYYLHNYREAGKYFEKAAELDPESPSYPQLFLARIALIDGNYSKAKQFLARFLQLHPNLPEIKNSRDVLKILNYDAAGSLKKVASSESHPKLDRQ
jgi:tetratricopeptide (TPR) repeat protein